MISDEGVVQVQQLELVDSAGTARAAIRLSDDEGVVELVLRDRSGAARIALQVHPDGAPDLVMADEHGLRARMLMDGTGAVSIRFYGPDGETEAQLP